MGHKQHVFVTAIAAGYMHSLALKSDTTVVSWGDPAYATPPAGLTNIVAIAAGCYHSLALRSNGTLVTWGSAPAIPSGLTNVTAIAAGFQHSLALKQDGTVIGWGDNGFGQCSPPAGLTNVIAIAAGFQHSLALKNDGSVVGWGFNDYAQCGVVTTPSGAVNTSVPNVYTIIYTSTNALGWRSTAERTVRIVDTPSVTTLPAINVTSRTVALQSRVHPNGLETLAWFQYGPTTNDYNRTTQATYLGNGFTQQSCRIDVPELTPEATYQFRAVASNSLGVTYGTNLAFTVLSTDANLSSLSLSDGTLSPVFSSDITAYAATVPNPAGYLRLVAVSADAKATLRVRIDTGVFTALDSGSASAPLYLNKGTNTIEVQVTAQDSVTTRSYIIALFREDPAGAFVGPSFPPPMNVNFSQTGQPNDDQIGRAAGKTWLFSNALLAETDLLFWGATNDGVKLSFDNNVFTNQEILTYQPGLSSLANGIALWSGQTLTPTGRVVYTRFILAVTNTDTGVAIPLSDAPSLGLATNIGAVLRVTPGLKWKAVLRFQASFNTTTYQPALDFFDTQIATNIPSARASSSFTAGFYHLNRPPILLVNNQLSVEQGNQSIITTAYLAASDFETLPPNLRFYIAPDEGGGPARNGDISINGINLTRGDFFTQADIEANRVLYTHSGNCETRDDFTFNVTDQHGGVARDGNFTIFSFRIEISQPNKPPMAFNSVASTGLMAPYHGFLAATNEDCVPQMLTFRLISSPTNGVVTLDNTNTGAFTYTPSAGKQGIDSFRFHVHDGIIESYPPGTFIIIVSNQPPTAIASSGVTRENVAFTGLLAGTDSDLPIQPLSFNVLSNGAKGTAVITNAATGGFTYTPNPDAIGWDQFAFTVGDGTLVSTPAAFSLDIHPNLDEGDLLASDGAAGQIVLIDPSGAQGVVASGALLSSPRGLAYEPTGTILVMDAVSGLIRIDPVSGNQTLIASPTNFSTGMIGAWGVAIEPSGTVLVTDQANGLLRVNSTTGKVGTLTSGGQIYAPISVACAPNGEIFVGDLVGAMAEPPSRIVRVNPSSGAQNLLTSGDHLLLPGAIAVEASGSLVVAEAPSLFSMGSDCLVRINPTDGNQTVLTSTNLLEAPIGLAIGSTGTIFVANWSGSIVAVDPITGDQTLFSAGGGRLAQSAALTVVKVQVPILLVNVKFLGSRVEMDFLGSAGRSYALERSVNLASWQQVTNATAAPNGVAQFVDPNPPVGMAFYRMRLP